MELASLSFTKTRPISATLLLLALSFSFIGCINRSRETSSPSKSAEQASARKAKANDQQSTAPPETNSASAIQQTSPRININTASANELEKLPGIGKGLAARIIEHREKYGPFRRLEHMIIVRGISDKRFRTLRDLVTVK